MRILTTRQLSSPMTVFMRTFTRFLAHSLFLRTKSSVRRDFRAQKIGLQTFLLRLRPGRLDVHHHQPARRDDEDIENDTNNNENNNNDDTMNNNNSVGGSFETTTENNRRMMEHSKSHPRMLKSAFLLFSFENFHPSRARGNATSRRTNA